MLSVYQKLHGFYLIFCKDAIVYQKIFGLY